MDYTDDAPPSKRRRLSDESQEFTTPPSFNREESANRANDSHRSSPQHRPHSQSDFSRSPSPIPLPPDSPPTRTTPLQKPLLTFTSLFTLPRAHARGITTVSFSPDNRYLATGSADATIKIYTIPHTPTLGTAWPLLKTLHAHLAGINALSWSPCPSNPSEPVLASASDDKSILLWSPITSDLPIRPSPLTGHANHVYSLAFSPKGNMLVSGSHDEAVFLWDVRSGRIMKRFPAHSDPVSGVDFVRDGSMVVSCSTDGLIRIWDASTGQCLKTLVDEDRKGVASVRFSPNGRFVVAWTIDGAIRLWDYLAGGTGGGQRTVKTYSGHRNERYTLGGCVGSYGVDGEGERRAFLASGSEDGDVFVWDVNTKEILWRGGGHRDVVLSVSYGRMVDGRAVLASGGKDRELMVWIEDRRGEVNGYAVEDEDDHVQLEVKHEDADMLEDEQQ